MERATRAITVSPEVTLNVDIYPGARDTIVMLPGLGLGAASFGDFPTRITITGDRVVAVNPRGAAGSTGPVENLTLHDLAADVAGLIEALGDMPVHVVGHAFGNRVARCLAVDRPELVRSVILVAAGGQAPPDPEVAEALMRPDWFSLSIEERKRIGCLAMLAPTSDPRLIDRFVQWPDATRAGQHAVRVTPLAEWWSGGRAPMLVIQGLEDRLAPPANGRALSADYGDRVRLVEVANAGHALFAEQPEAVASAILTWLNEHARVA